MHPEVPKALPSPRAGQLDRILGSRLWVSAISLVVALGVISLMSLLFGAQPVAVLKALFEGALRGRQSLVQTVLETTPTLLTGLAVLIPYQAGFFNIGGQGQLFLGALAAVIVATTMQGPPWLVIFAALSAALAAGALAAVVPLLLKVRRGANEVTTTIMMNFACLELVHAMITGVLKDPRSFYGATRQIPTQFRLPGLAPGWGVHVGVLVAAAVAVAGYWVMRRTVFGMQLRAVGYNRNAAIAAGIRADRVLTVAVLGGAALAGLAGGIQVLGVTRRVAEGWARQWGFTGISVAFLGGNAIGAIPVAFLLAILDTGARYMQAMTGVPSALVYLFQGTPVLLFVGLTAYRQLRQARQ